MDEQNQATGQPVGEPEPQPTASQPDPQASAAPQPEAQPSYAPYATAQSTAPMPGAPQGGQQAQSPYAGQPQPSYQAQAPVGGYSYASEGAATQQPGYYSAYGESYGGQQPPVPPTVPPVASPTPYGYEPTAPQQKRRWPWFLLGLAVGLVIGLGGCVSCAGIVAATSYDRVGTNYATPAVPDYDFGVPDTDDNPDYGYGYGYGYGQDDGSGQNSDGQEVSPYESAPGTYSLDEIKSVMFPNGVPSNVPAEGDVCKEGIYTVGKNGQIPAGLYYLEGAEDAESSFYVFEGSDTPNYYKVDDSVAYFGNYFVELDEGDLMVFKPGADLTMYPAPATSFEPKSPYNNGCYRVGVDIPAGSYTITSYAPSADVASADSGAFVMSDLDFDEDSLMESVYVIPGGKQVITVKDGQYLELFAATATPVSQG
ncbi:hypothetical protein PZH32_10090 [Adlercreutzia equolifaciens]|uniref:hypothetical protein n=1 Tax=Adlercreutzia equolifaciens TaxID=446660 RepID=UPI0023AEA570|nr:hypothetical protein [Adlercreutzia equolifaciens]MDE8703306.1 hypothetical protein [Adlercreutzia equolifaciens]